MLLHTGFGLQGCLLFSTQCGGAIGHPGLGVRRTGPDTDKAEHGGGPETSAAFLAPGDCRGRRRICSGGLASVVLLVSGAGPVTVLVILAAGAGVALAAGAGAFAVLAPTRAPTVQRLQPVTIPRTNQVEDVHAAC